MVRSRRFRWSVTVLLPLFFLQNTMFPNISLADTKEDVINALRDGIEISKDFKEKADAFTEPMETLTDTYAELAEAVAGGKHPKKPAIPYSVDDLVSKIDKLASQIETVPPPAIKDTSMYSVSIDMLLSCSTQDDAMARLHAYADGMDEVVSEGTADLQYAQQYSTAVNANLVKLNTAFGSLAWGPALDEFFTGKWQETNEAISAVSHLQEANKGRIERMNANIADMRTRANNLRSNLNLLPPSGCVLTGSWRGTCVMAVSGIKSSSTIVLNKSGYQQEGTFGFVGGSFPGASPKITNKHTLTFPFGKNNMGTLSGTFDNRFAQFNGSVAINGPFRANYSCNLSGSGN
jgi:hypothetical protein